MARFSSGVAALGLLLVLGLSGCSTPRAPVTFSEGVITVENQSDVEWRNVMITVNDHYRGGAPVLAANGRLTAPISQFQTAYGQRFEVVRQAVTKIEVAATDANGQPVSLSWGENK